MITVSFEKKGKTGLCDCIYAEIKNQIQSGTLRKNEKLPSKRSLAENLGVSVITVQNAYLRLIDEGYVYSLEKKGFFVSDFIFPNVKRAVQKNNAVHEEKMLYADLKSNAVGFEKFPFNQWARLMRSVINSGDEKLLKRTDSFGCIELRSAVCSYLREFRGMNVKEQQIVVGAGTENIYWLLTNLLGTSRVYAVENPGYRKISEMLLLNGAVCRNVSIDSHGLNMRSLEKSGAEIVHVSPSHHFPTGTVMSYKRRQELLDWAAKTKSVRISKKRFIIEDDFDSEFRFSGRPLPTLQSADVNDSVIYVNTFSKTLSPSFRIGFIVLPENLVPEFSKKFSLYSCPVSSFEQYTLSRFMSEGFYGAHIIRMKNYYRSLRNEFLSAIKKSSVSEYCTIQEGDAGLHFLLCANDPGAKASQKLDFKKIQKNLSEKHGINIPLLSDFFSGKKTAEAENTFVLNYSGIKKDKIPKIVKCLESELSLSV